jgi:hypothetical protein
MAISLTPEKVDLALYEGDTVTFNLVLNDYSGSPIDLFTGVTSLSCVGNIKMMDGATEVVALIAQVSSTLSKTASAGSSGSPNITLNNTTNLVAGMRVSGTGIAAGATVSSINTETNVVTLSANNIASVSGTVLFDNKLPNGNISMILTAAEAGKLSPNYSDKRYEIQISYTKDGQNIVKTVMYGDVTVSGDLIS